jgi:anti-sigma regulatory factor (Ser/Thr protein kinase)
MEQNPGQNQRKQPPRIVHRRDNRIRFVGKVNAQAHREFMGMLDYCLKDGYDTLVIDFSSVKNAYPNGMVPIITNIDYLKRSGRKIQLYLPSDIDVRRLFKTTNWAYHLDPDHNKEELTTHNRHLTSKRFHDATEQQNLVNEFLDVAMMNLQLERSVIAGLEWSINEITDNVLNHSESADGGIAQVSTFKSGNVVSFAVADSGLGIFRTLKKAIPTLNSDINAIGEAVKAGVTRDPELGQGNGLAGALRIATMSGGSFAITSGQGHINYFSGETRKYARKHWEIYQGTLVCADIGINSKNFSISEALGFNSTDNQATVDYIELNYLNESCDRTNFIMKSESTGFGNRPAGRQLRTKVINILNAELGCPIYIDWTGIPLISSSFADEFMGKLFLEMGAMNFSARVKNIGMETLIRELLDRAISQRLTQAADDSEEP